MVAPEQPSEIRNLVELGRLPDALGACLGDIAAVALGHALVVTGPAGPGTSPWCGCSDARRARPAGPSLTMALTAAALGAVCGIVLGVAAGGRLGRP